MGSICLSSAPILRCTSLSKLQSVLLVIPTALEVIFSTSLIFVNWNGGKRHLLLTAEGWVYFILSVVELVSDIVPGAHDNLSVFRAFDVGIGVTSFLPIFFYTFFLFILTSNDLVETLPKRIKNVAKLSLILFVPAIIIFNEIASFVGVTIGRIPSPQNPRSTQTIVAVGFSSDREESLSAFFTSTTLALLIAFQAAVFCFAFFRLCRALLDQRQFEKEGSDKAHFVNGMGWICGSTKIGALESVVGFAGGSFSFAITRRIMRMVARGCLCIGIVKGVDVLEDFHDVQRELRISKENDRETKNPLRDLMISNPRFSTFHRLSPTAREFHATPNVKAGSIPYITDKSELSKRPHYLTWTQRQSQMLQSGLPGMQDFANVKEAREKQRVTVLYNQGTPKLYMRFSTLDVPSPAVIVEKVKSRPQSELLESYRRATTSLHAGYASEYAYSEKDVELQAPMPHFHKEHPGPGSNRDSTNSTPSFGPYEIVDARKLPQTTAMAQVYKPPTTANTITAPSTTSAVEFFEPTYQVPPIPLDETQAQDFNTDRVKSMASVKSVPDSIKAVRELTHQFPGPPGISQIRPSANRPLPGKAVVQPSAVEIVEKSVWEEDSRISTQHLSSSSMPQVIGSPSQLIFSSERVSQEHSPSNTVDADVHLAYAGVENTMESSPARGGKVPITPGGYSRMSTPSRNKIRRPSSSKPIDPFNDNDASPQLPISPSYVPTPLRQFFGPSKARPLPTGADIETPTTSFSEMTRLRETVIENRIDPFLDFGTALDSGRSRQFRVSSSLPPPMPQPAMPQPRRPSIPTHTRKLSKSEEKLNRIVQWVDTSANVAVAVNPEIPVTPVTVDSPTEMQPSDRPRDNNLQNLHDRGPSIDALSIPWLKNPNISAEEKRRLGGTATVESSALRPQLARITTVGTAPSRTTPTPMRSAYLRGSMHLLPIVVPPRNGNLPEAVQIEYGSMESLTLGRGVERIGGS